MPGALVIPDLTIGDRRGQLRFEVVGTKSASLLSTQVMRVLNLGANGALVESTLPLPPNAEYRMQLVLEGHVSDATVKIRRVAEVAEVAEVVEVAQSRWNAGEVRYRIGLEFLAISDDAAEVIAQLVSASEARL